MTPSLVFMLVMLGATVLAQHLQISELKKQITTAKQAELSDCNHVWGEWSEPRKISVYQDGFKNPVRYYLVQTRTCTMCNQINTTKSSH